MTYISRSEAETIEIGRRLAATLAPGTILLLSGDLGAGKTALVRGIAGGLGADPEDVSSPTFTLIQEYRGRLPLFHVDLYRLEPRDVTDLGLEELGEAGGVVAIEWAEKLPAPLGPAIRIRIDDRGGDVRELTIVGPADEIIPPGSSALPS